MKIIEKINAILQSEKEKDKTFYSFEYFPPRTEQGKCIFPISFFNWYSFSQ